MDAKYFGISDLGQLIFYILHFSMNAVLATSLGDLTFFSLGHVSLHFVYIAMLSKNNNNNI